MTRHLLALLAVIGCTFPQPPKAGAQEYYIFAVGYSRVAGNPYWVPVPDCIALGLPPVPFGTNNYNISYRIEVNTANRVGSTNLGQSGATTTPIANNLTVYGRSAPFTGRIFNFFESGGNEGIGSIPFNAGVSNGYWVGLSESIACGRTMVCTSIAKDLPVHAGKEAEIIAFNAGISNFVGFHAAAGRSIYYREYTNGFPGLRLVDSAHNNEEAVDIQSWIWIGWADGIIALEASNALRRATLSGNIVINGHFRCNPVL